MKLLMAGASGFIGGAVARRLEREGHRVLRLVRRPAERPDEVEWHPAGGEVEQRERLEGAEAALNFAGSSLAAGRWTAARWRSCGRYFAPGAAEALATGGNG